MQQYNKEQLTGKTLDELREIADEYKINSNGLGERDLVYEILEEQAKAAAEKTTTQSTASRKRTRIQKVDRVYTANQEKAKKVDKTVMRSVDSSLFGSLSDEEKADFVRSAAELCGGTFIDEVWSEMPEEWTDAGSVVLPLSSIRKSLEESTHVGNVL